MLKKSLFFAFLFAAFFHTNTYSMQHSTTSTPRFLDTNTEKAITEMTNPDLQNIMRDFVTDPQSKSVKEWLHPRGFNKLSDTELLNAIAPLSVHEGILLLSIVALDDQLDDSFKHVRDKRLEAKGSVATTQYTQALELCIQAANQLETEVKPAFEKIKNINEKLTGPAAKVASCIFSSLKQTHSKIMQEELNIKKCQQDATAHLQD